MTQDFTMLGAARQEEEQSVLQRAFSARVNGAGCEEAGGSETSLVT